MNSLHYQQFSKSFVPSSFTSFISSTEDIKTVVAIDLGTTYCSFAYASKKSPNEIEINTRWNDIKELPKTNIALLYDNSCNEVLKWGESALLHEEKKRIRITPKYYHMVERFTLYLDDIITERPHLPSKLNYKKAIIDYLKKMKEIIEETLDKRWPGLKLTQILWVLCVPAEWGPRAKAIIRDCIYKAELLNESIGSHLTFTTKPEAAAIYCLSVIEEHKLTVGDTFLMVDCGGETVDLTMRTIQIGNRLKEETESIGDLCGSTFIDQEFLHFLGNTVGINALQKLRIGDLQRLVRRFFCQTVKFPFTGDPDEFETIELDLERQCPSLIQYITGVQRTYLENSKWIIELDFETIKKMFDPIIDKIIKLINIQLLDLPNRHKCKAMFLVGGFSESPYLIKRVKERFQGRIPVIAFPQHPMVASVKGAVAYGLNMKIIESRVLKWTYGVGVKADFDIRNDPPSFRKSDNKIWKFSLLAVRGTQVMVNKTFCKYFMPINSGQTVAALRIYITKERQPKYIDETGMQLLGTLKIDLLKSSNRSVKFELTFGTMEIKATAKNELTNETYHTTFEYQSSE
ncbi:actin-like ATPase domain-containing protein [Gigaspora margarita]|uniref:Actin-like ATPase domain-containing protein n=2 Tax=Gigaspora margarita TaxID=4874 RepID=A0A8H3X5Z0_GIGMA|nr:actin-like ATPase domain-containing protein [Gigaspora margarita]